MSPDATVQPAGEPDATIHEASEGVTATASLGGGEVPVTTPISSSSAALDAPTHVGVLIAPPRRRRVAFARQYARGIAARERELTDLMHDELAKPRWEAFTGDILPVLAGARWCRSRGKRLLTPKPVRGGGVFFAGQRQRIHRLPRGRVGIIATWNYPVSLLGIQLLHAVFAGNKVTVKPSERSPRTQTLLVEIARDAAHKAGLPDDTIELLSHEREQGAALVARASSHTPAAQRIDHLVFTGSTAVGERIAVELAGSLTTSTLELSGRDSAFVLADADPHLAARIIFWAVAMNAGQTCMAPKRVLVERSVYDAFCRALGSQAAAARPRELVDARAAQLGYEQATGAIARGGRSASGIAEPPEGRRFRPLAIVDCPADAPLVKGRNFAPVTAVVPVDSLDEALAIHHACDQHLATSVFTRRPAHVRRTLAPRLGARSVTINNIVMPTAHPGASIGGIGPSGWGTSQGEDGLLDMTHPVTISATGSFRPPTDPPAPKQAEQLITWMRRLLGR